MQVNDQIVVGCLKCFPDLLQLSKSSACRKLNHARNMRVKPNEIAIGRPHKVVDTAIGKSLVQYPQEKR